MLLVDESATVNKICTNTYVHGQLGCCLYQYVLCIQLSAATLPGRHRQMRKLSDEGSHRIETVQYSFYIIYGEGLSYYMFTIVSVPLPITLIGNLHRNPLIKVQNYGSTKIISTFWGRPILSQCNAYELGTTSHDLYSKLALPTK